MHRIVKIITAASLVCLMLCMCALMLLGARRAPESVQTAATAIENAEPADAVERFRTLRQQLRAMEKAQLNDVAHDAGTDAELVAMARRQIVDICNWEEQELTIEGVLEMRGYARPVVTVHADSVNVLIPAEVITQQQSSVIMELVCRETGVQGGNVKIIPIN